MTIRIAFGWKTIVVALVVIVGVLVSLVAGSEYYTSRPEFCGGTCHIMKPQYEAWKKDTEHKETTCVDCHYVPGEKATLKAKFKGLGQVFSYLAAPDAPLRKRAVVKDESCTTAGCHAGDEYRDKEIKFNENVVFKHKTHEEKTIEGQKLHCNTCHVKYSAEKHFEVPKELCFLCHFRKAKFNEGRSKCALCHEIPTKSLQSQKSEGQAGSKPITHQTLEEAKVSCESCHYQLVSGSVELKKENCRDCHYKPEVLAKTTKEDKKLMHEAHVAAQQADCFDCHQPIEHKEPVDFLDPVRLSCQKCHSDQHRFAKILLEGAERGEVSSTPSLMRAVKTNCLGCHVEVKHENGEEVLAGSAKACVACHTKEEEQVLEDWKRRVDKEVKYAKELEEEAQQAIAAAEGTMPADKLKEAMALLEEGRENLHIVEYGNGVHNRKYAILLLDEAMNSFEDLLDSLEE